MNKTLPSFGLLALSLSPAAAEIPATPVMSLYQFNGAREVPYYAVDDFRAQWPGRPAGTLAQGTSLIPCLVIRDGEPLTDAKGTPYVGFELVVDARKATGQRTRMPSSAPSPGARGSWYAIITAARRCSTSSTCASSMPWRRRHSSTRPEAGGRQEAGKGGLDAIVRAFHNSSQCADANRSLLGRRGGPGVGLGGFSSDQSRRLVRGDWPGPRGSTTRCAPPCSRVTWSAAATPMGPASATSLPCPSAIAPGRAAPARQGCRRNGDFQGVSSNVSQYNIWDEYLTGISGLTSCYPARRPGRRALLRQAPGHVRPEPAGRGGHPVRQRRGPARGSSPGRRSRTSRICATTTMPRPWASAFPTTTGSSSSPGPWPRKGGDFALIANTRIQRRRQGGRGLQLQGVPLRSGGGTRRGAHRR